MSKVNGTKKKVCLVSWFQSHNYGTNLQAYALIKALNNLNCECILNDFVYKNIDFFNINWVWIKFCQKLNLKKKNILHRKLRKSVNSNFSDRLDRRENLYKKYMLDNYKFAGIKNKKGLLKLCEWADYFISGSDQAWNPYYLNRCYLLDFVNDSTPKISYAASFGVNALPAWSKSTYKDLLNRYKSISVREKQGISIIKNVVDHEVEHVVDPTLLITRREWQNFALNAVIKENVRNLKEGYILCYFVGDKEQYWKHVDEIKNMTGLTLIVIPLCLETFFRKDQIYIEVGPYEFVWLIENASIICTDSFHAVVFSLIFNKNFYVFKRFLDDNNESQNSRLYSLLEILGLEDYYVDPNSNCISQIKGIEYTIINKKLEDMRKRSLMWLKNALDIDVN
ncbi:polysaccharide pyruvyl transferase family protein|uniref:Polysaccharide pyruvyl transferase n=1 Tax=Dendrosporobacter quercicolus TaxID=146817 RepID=A0A1G9WQ51_9FIRM|nr:polysaccharide pyruvyl transferase family protein [Dendrosporobacter quercicolus]NSL49171.1 polysaccharide pyruvyl transferase family protein [Dendrosporobacter quercicolus DSM 1736]SDM86371.1 Polysaccharide pyruvyl transferase [Dendrosporobacter quercicolus]